LLQSTSGGHHYFLLLECLRPQSMEVASGVPLAQQQLKQQLEQQQEQENMWLLDLQFQEPNCL